MAGTSKLMDDFARLVTDATGAAQGVRREVETMAKGQVERILRDMNVATREETDVLRDMIADLRAECDTLKLRVATLEASSGRNGPGL